MVKRVLVGLLMAWLLAGVAWAQDYTASDRIKTSQEAAQRLCKSGDWLVISKYRRLDLETDGKSWLYTVVFRHLNADDKQEVVFFLLFTIL